MVGKKKIALLLSGLLLGLSLAGCSGETKKIGIVQLVQHKALDEARTGFEEGLKEKGYEDGKNIEIDYQNAQGEIPTANTIAQQFVNQNKDLIFAIATPAAQAAYNNTKDIPIVFTAVTDPIAAKLANDWKKSGTNLTGTSDMVDIEKQLVVMKKIIPNMKTIGIVYNTSEENSIVQVQELEKQAKKLDMTVKKIGVTNVNDVNQNLPTGLSGVDVLYTPTDNTVASAYSLVTKLCLDKKIPILGAEPAVVEAGGLCTIGIDYKQLGKEAAYKAVEILEGKQPSEIEITKMTDVKLTINTDAAKKLGLTIPEELLKDAEKITGGVN